MCLGIPSWFVQGSLGFRFCVLSMAVPAGPSARALTLSHLFIVVSLSFLICKDGLTTVLSSRLSRESNEISCDKRSPWHSGRAEQKAPVLVMTVGAAVTMVMTNEVAPSQREDSLILSSANYVISTLCCFFRGWKPARAHTWSASPGGSHVHVLCS